MESIAFGVLNEELDRNKRKISILKDEVALLPKGYIVEKKRKYNIYCYLNSRKNHKVISKYIGVCDSDKVNEIKLMVGKRKEIDKNIKRINIEIHSLSVALRKIRK